MAVMDGQVHRVLDQEPRTRLEVHRVRCATVAGLESTFAVVEHVLLAAVRSIGMTRLTTVDSTPRGSRFKLGITSERKAGSGSSIDPLGELIEATRCGSGLQVGTVLPCTDSLHASRSSS